MSTIWTDEETEIVREMLVGKTPADVAGMASDIFGRRITDKAIRDRFRRERFEQAKARAMTANEEVLERLARVDTTQKRVSELADVALIIPDLHAPFHDTRALDLVHKAAEIIKPTIIMILGDFVDFASVSFHSKDPSRLVLLKDEAGVARTELARFDRYKARRKIYIAGNHEARLNRYIADKAPAMAGIVDCRSLLGLDESGWEFVPYREHTKIGKLYATHDTGEAGINAHRAAGAAFARSVVIGHTHMAGVQYFGDELGQTHVAANLGWLGSDDGIDYMHKIKMRKWQKGFGVAYLEKDDTTHLMPIPIINYRCLVNGQLVVG